MDTMNDPQNPDELEALLRKKQLELAFAHECLAKFTYGISHEINSPANTLKNLLDLLEGDLQGQLDNDTAELLNMVQRSSRRLCDTITGVLEFSAYCRAPNLKEPIDCSVLIKDVLAELAPVIESRRASITVEPLPVINSSVESLKMLFHHLVDNALKFTHTKDEAPVIHIAARARDEGYEFIVSDQGQGVISEKQDSIFCVFERLNTQAQHGGAGIGLALCRQIVTALGGEIWVEPGESRGAAFHVYLSRE